MSDLSNSTIDSQLMFLRERNRFIDDMLELTLKFNDFSMFSEETTSFPDVLSEAFSKLSKLISLKAGNFYLIDDESGFYRVNLKDETFFNDFIELEKESLISDGSFAWALNRNKPVILRASNGEGTLLLHSIVTSNRVMGMFIGILDMEKEELFDSHLYLVTVVLTSAAGMIQYLELYSRVQRLNKNLQDKVFQLTTSEKQLTHYKSRLESLVDLRTSELEEANVKLGKTLSGVIDAMGKIVESRDPYTAGHQRRVSKIATALAKKIGLDEEQVEGVRIAGLVHDIGKISIPSEILTKPARLSELEFRMVKCHPQIGFDMLCSIDFPWPVAEMVLQHHERMDGSGYPKGLEGDEILPGARCIAVADVVEAISSYRPYRPSLGVDEAVREIQLKRGSLYDPSVVDACLSLASDPDFACKYLKI